MYISKLQSYLKCGSIIYISGNVKQNILEIILQVLVFKLSYLRNF